MGSRALYVPCYRGELGWELINYVPHIQHVCKHTKYDEVHCVVRRGRESLYPMGTHFYPIDLSTKKSMGNNGAAPPKDKIASKLEGRFKVVDSIKTPGGGCKYIKHRKYIKYSADDKTLWKWRHIPQNSVVLCVRGRNFGVHKNWAPEKWLGLIDHLIKKDFTPIVSGIKELIDLNLPSGCMDVQNKTTMGDLLAIMQRSKFAVGQSTGPLHFASLSGVPHAVWGSARIKDRYIKSWNPHRTLVEYFVCKKDKFDCTVEEAIGLIDRLLERLE